MTFVHRPVLVQEVIDGLALKPGAVVLDATLGLGGHAERMLKEIGAKGRLIGMDRDEDALELAQDRLKPFGDRVSAFHGRFGQLGEVLDRAGITAVDAVLFDLGVSSMQLEKAERGFSFGREGPLDMRMDRKEEATAADWVNHASARDLERIIREYGEERYAGRIAQVIMRNRPFSTTTRLAEAIRGAVPAAYRHGRIDPSPRVFQAIRISVNRELEELSAGLEQAVERLKASGRVAVLAYHSLEDRRVKNFFRERAKTGEVRLVTRKPVRPSPEETAENPRSRSARLRVAEKP